MFIPLLSPLFCHSNYDSDTFEVDDESESIHEYFFSILLSLLLNLSDDMPSTRRIVSKFVENNFGKLRRVIEIREYHYGIFQEGYKRMQNEDFGGDSFPLDQGSNVLQLIDCSLVLLISHNNLLDAVSEVPAPKHLRQANIILEAINLLMEEHSHHVSEIYRTVEGKV